MLQSQLKSGYNRAGRIMHQLEAAGIVGGGFNGAKAREVMISGFTISGRFLGRIEKVIVGSGWINVKK